MSHALRPLTAALDRAAEEGRTIRVWLRDDDCVAPTIALDRLATLCEAVRLPVLLAVIPAHAEEALGAWIRDHPRVTPCQHGFAHANHARPGERSIEFGGSRASADLCRDLARGRARLKALFGPRLADVLVPPWNRIDPALLPRLGDLGFTALSTIAPSRLDGSWPRLDCDLDVMDWRGGRVGKPLATLAMAAAGIVARQDRLGLLTHHLVHNEAAWAGLSALVDVFASHPGAAFADARQLIEAAKID